MCNAIRPIEVKSKNRLWLIVLLALSSHAAAQAAHQYLYTNNNVWIWANLRFNVLQASRVQRQ